MPGAGRQVEVLLATYNSEAHLAAFLESLLAQTFKDFVLVVSDDVSQDATLGVIADYAPRFQNPVRVTRRDVPSGGAMANFAAMLEATDADYVFLADHDDIWLPDKITAGLARIQGAEQAVGSGTPVLVHSDLRVIGVGGEPLAPSYWAFKQIRPEAGCRLPSALVHATVTGCASVLNRALVERACPIPKEAVMHDWWLNLVAAAFGVVEWDRRAQVEYRIHGANVSRPRKVSMRSTFTQLDRARSLRTNMQRRYRQGALLRERYRDALPVRERAELDAFANLQSLPPVARQLALVRGGFLWPGVWRNVIQLPFA